MTSVVQRLLKILESEKQDGCRDKMVFGGLARFTDTWLKEAPQEASDEAWVQKIAEHLQSYSQLSSPDERRASLEKLEAVLQAGARAIARPNSQRTRRVPTRATTNAPSAPREVARPASGPAQPSPTPAAYPAPRPGDAGLDSSITTLSGIGPVQSKRLARLGVRTIRDMLYFFPRRYDDFSTLKTINQLEYGEEVTIMGRVWDVHAQRTRSGRTITKAVIEDGSGTIEATWFNQPHLAEQLRPLRQVVISGKVDEYLGRLTFLSPQWEPLDRQLLHTARLVPIYPLTEGLAARWLRKTVTRTVGYWSQRVPDHLPKEVRQRVGLYDLETALRQIHLPESADALKKARYRLAFDELFVIQIGVLRQRLAWQSEPGYALPADDAALQRFVLGLPFELTGAQQRALSEIVHDLRRDRPMSRLLQGDVGSGKTVVAAAVMALVVAAGAQAALMAPTEILAEQHYHTLTRLLQAHAPPQPEMRLLTGSTPPAEKEAIYRGLADGSVDLVVGTHALIQEGVQFKQLVLAIVDEQHRFGVEQRSALRQKGFNPHVLVMTATPIPRSLALTIFGDLDLSIIDEMPPGRQAIQTRMLLPTERERAYAFVRTQINQGRQAFIICPLVQESEKIEAKAAVEEHERLQKHIFPDLRLGLLHGRMSGDAKEAVMSQFARGELHILVSTSVVEVGIDVPNATVMLVEGANRFGLAQLHQFRGRVGRGEHASYCLLIADSSTDASQERLQAIEATQDGFELAEKDLELRGPGEFFGTRQSGLPDLKLARVADLRLLEVARREAQLLFDADPKLSSPDLRLLLQQVDRFWSDGGDISS
jgi:ATP-dependent DNA helicase RecG